MRCPSCKNKLLTKSAGMARLRIEGAVEFLDDGTSQARCWWCKSMVPVPLDLKKSADVEEERFTIPEKTKEPRKVEVTRVLSVRRA